MRGGDEGVKRKEKKKRKNNDKKKIKRIAAVGSFPQFAGSLAALLCFGGWLQIIARPIQFCIWRGDRKPEREVNTQKCTYLHRKFHKARRKSATKQSYSFTFFFFLACPSIPKGSKNKKIERVKEGGGGEARLCSPSLS